MLMPDIVVLLIDNDRDFLDTRAERVIRAGYQVLRAYSLDEAYHYLSHHRVHVMVSDIRLGNDDDERDTRGLTLAKDVRYRAIPKIILTGYPSYQYVREVMGSRDGSLGNGLPAAVDFLAKDEGPEAMIAAIREAVTQHVRINWDLRVRWNGLLSFPQLIRLINPTVIQNDLSAHAAEIEDLFRCLFHYSEQITLDEVLLRGPDYLLLKLYAFNQTGLESHFVVACGQVERIRDTMQRYRAAALQHVSTTSLDQSLWAETVHYAAAAYRFLGASLVEVVPLKTYYRRSDLPAIESVINQLYQTTLRTWYEQSRHYREQTVVDFYLEWLEEERAVLEATDWSSQIASLCDHMLEVGALDYDIGQTQLHFSLLEGQLLTLSNPATSLAAEHFKPLRQGQWSITHGRVNLETVLISLENRCWLADFSQVGEAPLLHDFASLEVAFKSELLAHTDLMLAYTVEQRLLAAADLRSELLTEGLPPSVAGLLKLIQVIRHAAATLAGCTLPTYQLGLFFHTLALLSRYQPDVHYYRRELMPYAQALVAAAVLGDLLLQPATNHAAAPITTPTEATQRPIWLDKRNRTLWVEQNPIRLAPLEFQIIGYLYAHANQLCTRHHIVEEGLKEKYDEYDREQSRLNSAINRLRKKIEPDPQNPHYLITIHGYGYKLMIPADSL